MITSPCYFPDCKKKCNISGLTHVVTHESPDLEVLLVWLSSFSLVIPLFDKETPGFTVGTRVPEDTDGYINAHIEQVTKIFCMCL